VPQVLAVAVGSILLAAGLAACTAPSGAGASAAAARPPVGVSPSPATAESDPDFPDPAGFAAGVIRESRAAGINPQLLMAIVYNESYKPHSPASQRLWAALNPGASLGIVNMHQAAFEQARHGRSFSARRFAELPDDPELALQAAAWYLNDLAAMLPAEPKAKLTHDQLLALGYNTGPSNMRLFARGVIPGPMAETYLDRF
jgi:soluble lytic murein transglycosylase-like protein